MQVIGSVEVPVRLFFVFEARGTRHWLAEIETISVSSMLKIKEIFTSAMFRERRVLICAGGVLAATVLGIILFVFAARLKDHHRYGSVGNFKKIIDTSANNGRIPVIVFRSNKTGLRVAFGNGAQEGYEADQGGGPPIGEPGEALAVGERLRGMAGDEHGNAFSHRQNRVVIWLNNSQYIPVIQGRFKDT